MKWTQSYVVKATESSKKSLNFKQSRKPHIYDIRCLRLNSRVKNSRKSQRKLYSSFSDSLSLSNSKRLPIKTFFEETLVSLTLEWALSLNIFGKTQPILLYWFAAQQQTSTSIRQKCGFFQPKCYLVFNELFLMF